LTLNSICSSVEVQHVIYLLLGRRVKSSGVSNDVCDMPTVKIVSVAYEQGYGYDGGVNEWHSSCLRGKSFNTYVVLQ
jgi:hypothetical protein